MDVGFDVRSAREPREVVEGVLLADRRVRAAACPERADRLSGPVCRLDLERAKERLASGAYAEARYDLAASQDRSMEVPALRMALRLVPRFARPAYLLVRPPAAADAATGLAPAAR